MEVAPDVALWQLGLGRLGRLGPRKAHDQLDDEPGDEPDEAAAGPLLRSSTLEDLSDDAAAMDALLSAATTTDTDSDSDRSVDSLEEEAAARGHALGPVPPPRLPREHDMLARLSGGECRALPAVLEEDEEESTLDEESVTVLQALGWASSLDESYCPTPPPPPTPLRRTLSTGALSTSPSPDPRWPPRRTSSAPQLLPVTPVPTPTPSPTLTNATGSSPNASTSSTACAEALESAEALCRYLDEDRTLSQSVSVDEDMVFDDEFLALCSEANRLVETCLHPGTEAIEHDLVPSEPASPQPPKFDINAIFDRGLEAGPPRPPARKRRKARAEHAEQGVGVDVVRCHTAELLLMTRASERTHLKRSRSVSDREDAPQRLRDGLCASSPELRSPQSPLEAIDAVPEDEAASSPQAPQARRKGSVSSDVVAWQGDLLWAALSDSDAEASSCLETKQWFSSSDNKGRVYFFEENSCESSWNLPDLSSSVLQENDDDHQPLDDNRVLFSTPNDDGVEKPVKIQRIEKQEKISLRATKSRSMVIVDSVGKDSKMSTRNWPQLFDGNMCVLKEGTLCRTKITENGKKLRKNWVSSHVVLTELFLLLFRDAKSFAAMKSSAPGSAAPRPELTVDLNGALIDQIDRGDKASVTSRKNVFLVSTVYGLQVLFQCDSSQQAEEWYSAVHTAIHNLPSGFDSCPRIKVTKEMDRLFGESNSPEQTKKFPRIGRSKSVKIKNKDGSIEDLTVSVAERQTKIKARLKKFFNRRPTMESLVKKGIWKDEPAFGCFLEQVCGNESPRVPLFVQRCIAVIESSEDNMKTDGLYRASGNLSQVQKIRLQVDQNNLSALEQEEDVHVLTGALKLFFRELKEPLIPYAAFSKAIKASTLQNKKDKLSHFREIVKSLPTANHDTLKFLLKHLLKVTSYQEFNRMHIPNLAIVFGPTLMWPEQESLNMALDLMQQNLVIEAFLLDFDSIFR